MTANSWVVAAAFVTGAAGLAVALIQFFSAKTTAKIAVDAVAFTNAEGIYRNIIDELKERIEALREENRDFKVENADLRMAQRKLAERVNDLEKTISEQGLSVPPHTPRG